MALRIPPLALAAAAGAVQAVLTKNRKPTAASTVAAAGFAAGSAYLMAGSALEFRRAQTTVNPLEPGASTLVTWGPNRWSRNPMYVGMASALLSLATLKLSVAAVLPVGAFVLWIDRFQIPPEEAALRENFGAEFDAYTRATPRWIGA